ncbi:jg24317 [Pararge aegeria aegeria]|uniref:Jg24317 protein n=1 Tax=Pararge aegeria aegeria TaxID=348720 RepID=A0A8S4S7P7_9NEOP|nr:jg24317 [Pararge aegeria aegeria]
MRSNEIDALIPETVHRTSGHTYKGRFRPTNYGDCPVTEEKRERTPWHFSITTRRLQPGARSSATSGSTCKGRFWPTKFGDRPRNRKRNHMSGSKSPSINDD